MTSLLSFSRMISLVGTNTAFGSTAVGGMIRKDAYVLNILVTSLSTAAWTFVGSRIRSAFVKENSFCCRCGGMGRKSVDRLVRVSGVGWASRFNLSRMAARRMWCCFRMR